ncbi:MAG: tail fiber domain-containing protein, partial [Anaerolineae bacterium]
QFLVRAYGGSRFEDGAGLWVELNWSPIIDTSTGAYLSNGGIWTNASDRDVKENFTLIDGQEVLTRLTAVPISTWNYKAEDSSVRHIGPTAQDFYATFGLGDSDKAIGTLDADGVALAAIQGLYQVVQEKDAQIAAQQQRIDDLETRVAALEQAAGAPRSSQLNLPGGWWPLFLGGLVVAAGVVVQRRHPGGGQ